MDGKDSSSATYATQAGSVSGDSGARGPDALDDAALEAALAEQRETLAGVERAFITARDRFDRQRRRVRALEEELERRKLAATGAEAPAPAPPKARRKRSTTGIDALLGRDGVDPNRPLHEFGFFSLQRQEIYLNDNGNRNEQVLGLIEPDTGALHEAETFGQAQELQQRGYKLGRPGVPLQRQAIWYVQTGKPGWLRLDQVFVEQDVEGD